MVREDSTKAGSRHNGPNTLSLTDKSRLFISWEPYNSRSDALAKAFGADCRHIHYLKLKSPLIAPLKYLGQTFSTLRTCFRERPSYIFVQNPPVFAPLCIWFYSRLKQVPFVIDSHTGVFLEPKWKWLSGVHRFVARRATVNIVTNEYLGEQLRRWGADYFIISDVPMELDSSSELSDYGPIITVVNSFSYDEPLIEILEAASRLPDVKFSVTGDTKRCPKEIAEKAPSNVHFTGFVSRHEYLKILGSSAGALVLTKEDHTMQRGAYEAMSLGVPIITSDWRLLRDTFFKGAIFVDNSVESITAAVENLFTNKDQLRRDIAELRSERRAIWADRLHQFSTSYLTE